MGGGHGQYANPLKAGDAMIGRGAGVVVESRHPDVEVGDAVQGEFGWREHAVLEGRGLRKLPADLRPLSLSLGIVGQSGATAMVGLALFAVGAYGMYQIRSHIQDRVEIWLDPFKPGLVEHQGYQIAQSLFAQGDGGLFGTGFGQALLSVGGTPLLPAADTDLIYAVIVNELGLAGACGLLLVYLLFCERGMKVAMLATDSFSKLLATGLTAVFALQVFVIVGGVTKVIPLTGVTLPFVSYGGSSIVANFVLLALLLLISDRARRPAHLR